MPTPSQFWTGVALVSILALGTVGAVGVWAEETVAPATEPASKEHATEPSAEPATAAPATEPAAEPAAADAMTAPVSADTVVARVNGTDITVGHMILLREQLPAEYQNLPDDVLFRGILDQLIQQTALSQSVEGHLTRRDDLSLENDRRAYLARAAVDAATAVPITDEALQAAYDAKYGTVEPTREYHAAHILVATEEEAKALKAEIDGGADFGEVAMAHSTDGAAASGGDLGWFGPGMMVKEFEDAVVAMTAGNVSDPVKTQFGWHLVKLIETRSATAPTLDTVRDELSADIRQKAVEARITELTSPSAVTRSDKGIDPGVLRDASLLDQ